MKFLAVLAALVAVASAGNVWTLQNLEEALASPYTDPALKPYLTDALNEFMSALWHGEHIEHVSVTVPSNDVASMTLNELSEAIQNPNTDPAMIPMMEAALNEMMAALAAGQPLPAPAAVAAPSMELHYYTLNSLSEALQDPATNPGLLPYLEAALNEMMISLWSGSNMNSIVIVVPVGLEPIEVPAVPTLPVEEVVIPVKPIQEPATPASPSVPSSPLVQIIINIEQQ